MKINKQKSIRELQAEFSAVYPGLKIEFFNKKHDDFKGSLNNTILEKNTKIGECVSNPIEGEIALDSEKTIKEVENEFQEKFGLNAQIYRRSNELWLQTINTDNWTLSVQNRKGIHSLSAHQ